MSDRDGHHPGEQLRGRPGEPGQEPGGGPPPPAEPRKRRRRGFAPGRLLLVWIVSAATLAIVAELASGVTLKSFGAALWVVALVGLVNALVWPLLLRVALPLTVLTLGFGVLLVNAAVVWGLSELNLGLHVSTFGGALVITICMTITNTAATGALAIDDDSFWYHNVVERNARRTAPGSELEKPGLLLLEIDGLAHDVLVRALRDGNAPDDGALAARGLPPPAPLGDRLVLADRRLPGGPAARLQRGHAGLPLVGEGARRGDRHQPPARRGRARAPPLRRPRAAATPTAPAAPTSSPATPPTRC